jgi:uncharacterized protein (DUF427 family)
MAFTNDHLMQVAPMRLRERNLFMSAPDDHPIRIVANPKRLRASLNGRVVADTMRALTLFEASYPGVRYVPLADVDMTVLRRSTHKTRCPFKGEASYYSIVTANGVAENAIWTYENPFRAAAKIAGFLAFDTTRVDLFEGVKV